MTGKTTRSRRREGGDLTRRLVTVVIVLVVTAGGTMTCVEAPSEPPVLIGAITLRRVEREPERFTLAIPVVNRGAADLERYAITAVVVADEDSIPGGTGDDEGIPAAGIGERRAAARLVIETSVPVGARRVDEIAFDCPFPVVPSTPLRLEDLSFREFSFGGDVHDGVLPYRSPVVEER